MKFNIGLCQMKTVDCLKDNLLKAEQMIKSAVDKGAHVVVLPEMFQTPYENSYFIKCAERKDTTYQFLCDMAKKYEVLLVGGSYAYTVGSKLYNACFVFDKTGTEIGHHNKMHLFDIDVPGGIRFMESDTLSPGEKVTVIETEFGKIGVTICYDMRFPELYRAMSMAGAEVIITPAAFNMTTGPAHWHILAKGRALDNQVYNCICSPARDEDGVYVAYGHSLVISPWGEIIGELGAEEDVLIVPIDTDFVGEVRGSIPTYKHLKWGEYPNPFNYYISELKEDLYYINASNRYLKADCWMEEVKESHVVRNNHWTLPLFEDHATLDYFVAERTENYIGFPGVKKSIYDYMKKNLIIVWDNPTALYYYNESGFEIDHDYDIGPLKLSDFDIVHDHYSYQSDISKEYITRIIENNMTLCLRIDGQPVSWVVEHMDGSMGIMYTLEDHRRKGYGEILSKVMINQFVEKGITPYIHIEVTNEPSKRLAERLHFKYFDTVYWFGAVKEKNVSRND